VPVQIPQVMPAAPGRRALVTFTRDLGTQTTTIRAETPDGVAFTVAVSTAGEYLTRLGDWQGLAVLPLTTGPQEPVWGPGPGLWVGFLEPDWWCFIERAFRLCRNHVVGGWRFVYTPLYSGAGEMYAL